MSFKNILDKTPLQVAGAITAIVNFFILIDVLEMDGKAVSGLNLALVALLGLFVAQKTANKAVLNEFADAVSVAEQEAVAKAALTKRTTK